jgi:hypothetical protein
MPGFYEDYKREKQKSQDNAKTAVIKRSFGMAAVEFITKLFTAVIYLFVIALSSVGATTLLNGQLRDMLFELVKSTFFSQ